MKDVSLCGYNDFGKNYVKYYKEFDTYKSIKEYKMYVESQKKEDGGIYNVSFTRSKMGGMCSDRENLIRTETFPLSDLKHVVISKAVEMEEYPVAKDCVRMEFFKASQIEQVGNDIHIIEFQTMDLKGYFPKSIMNKV